VTLTFLDSVHPNTYEANDYYSVIILHMLIAMAWYQVRTGVEKETMSDSASVSIAVSSFGEKVHD
jgi:hypothetical protein